MYPPLHEINDYYLINIISINRNLLNGYKNEPPHCLYGSGPLKMAVEMYPSTLFPCTSQPRLFKVTGSSNEYHVVNIILIVIISTYFLAVGRETWLPVEDEFSVGKQHEHMSDQEALLE